MGGRSGGYKLHSNSPEPFAPAPANSPAPASSSSGGSTTHGLPGLSDEEDPWSLASIHNGRLSPKTTSRAAARDGFGFAAGSASDDLPVLSPGGEPHRTTFHRDPYTHSMVYTPTEQDEKDEAEYNDFLTGLPGKVVDGDDDSDFFPRNPKAPKQAKSKKASPSPPQDGPEDPDLGPSDGADALLDPLDRTEKPYTATQVPPVPEQLDLFDASSEPASTPAKRKPSRKSALPSTPPDAPKQKSYRATEPPGTHLDLP